MWRNLTIFVAFPVIVLAHINAFMPPADGHEVKHRPDFVAYEYLRVRTKVRLSLTHTCSDHELIRMDP